MRHIWTPFLYIYWYLSVWFWRKLRRAWRIALAPKWIDFQSKHPSNFETVLFIGFFFFLYYAITIKASKVLFVVSGWNSSPPLSIINEFIYMNVIKPIYKEGSVELEMFTRRVISKEKLLFCLRRNIPENITKRMLATWEERISGTLRSYENALNNFIWTIFPKAISIWPCAVKKMDFLLTFNSMFFFFFWGVRTRRKPLNFFIFYLEKRIPNGTS